MKRLLAHITRLSDKRLIAIMGGVSRWVRKLRKKTYTGALRVVRLPSCRILHKLAINKSENRIIKNSLKITKMKLKI